MLLDFELISRNAINHTYVSVLYLVIVLVDRAWRALSDVLLHGQLAEEHLGLLVAGAQVDSMTLNELNYAPEIASAMLKKQQAGALIEARELIAEGAVQISLDAVTRLEGKMQIERDEKVKIVTNLLTICTGEENAKPVLTL